MIWWPILGAMVKGHLPTRYATSTNDTMPLVLDSNIKSNQSEFSLASFSLWMRSFVHVSTCYKIQNKEDITYAGIKSYELNDIHWGKCKLCNVMNEYPICNSNSSTIWVAQAYVSLFRPLLTGLKNVMSFFVNNGIATSFRQVVGDFLPPQEPPRKTARTDRESWRLHFICSKLHLIF